MLFDHIEDVIPESNIICVSPHYDDFLFFLGGYVLEMKRRGLLAAKRFYNINSMTRTNYQERDIEGNKDRSRTRIQYATGIRIIEDLECLDELLGRNNYFYRAMGEEESLVRGKAISTSEGEMEMSVGSYETMDESDRAILNRMEIAIREMVLFEDTAIVLPLSMKGHIDHFIIREAGVRAMTDEECKASVYFAEDKPYAGLMTEEENKSNDDFINEYALEDRAFAGHPIEMIRLAYQHYPSQVDSIYDKGILARNKQLKQIYNTDADCDRIYKWA